MNYNPHDVHYNSSMTSDILAFSLLKYGCWLLVLAATVLHQDSSRQSLIIRGNVPPRHLVLLFLLVILYTALLFAKDALAVGLSLADTISFSLASVLAGRLIRQPTDIRSLMLLMQRLSWLVIGAALYQYATGYVGPHFGRVISTLGGPENLSMFGMWMIGLFLYRLRFYSFWFDQFISMTGIILLVFVLLLAQTLTAQIATGIYMLLCVAVLGGRTLWVFVLSIGAIAGGVLNGELFQDSIYKFYSISSNLGHYSRYAEHELFWNYLTHKASLVDFLFGVNQGVTKFENLYYSMAYNYGFPVGLLFILLVFNAMAVSFRAWRQLRTEGSPLISGFAFIHFAYFCTIVLASGVTPYLSSFPVNLYAWLSVGITLQLPLLVKRERYP